MLADMTDFSDLGFVKVAVVAPPVVIADPAANARAILDAYSQAPADAAIVLQPESRLDGPSTTTSSRRPICDTPLIRRYWRSQERRTSVSWWSARRGGSPTAAF